MNAHTILFFLEIIFLITSTIEFDILLLKINLWNSKLQHDEFIHLTCLCNILHHKTKSMAEGGKNGPKTKVSTLL